MIGIFIPCRVLPSTVLLLSQFATKADITKLENDIKHLEARLELKMFKHTVFIMSVIVLTSPSVKELVRAILHLR